MTWLKVNCVVETQCADTFTVEIGKTFYVPVQHDGEEILLPITAPCDSNGRILREEQT